MKKILCVVIILLLSFSGVSFGTDVFRRGYEHTLGNPAGDGYFLTSTAAGVRSWSNSLPLTISGGTTDEIAWWSDAGVLSSKPTISAPYLAGWVEAKYIPISDCVDGTAAPAALDSTTRKPYKYRDFIHTAAKDVLCLWMTPANFKASVSISLVVHYLITSATPPGGAGVVWAVQGASVGHGEVTQPAKGDISYIISTPTSTTQWTIGKTGTVNPVITGIGASEAVELAVARMPLHSSDTYNQSTGMTGITIYYGVEPVDFP